MKIKHDKEKDYADFTAAQNASASRQAMVRFIETWSGMMEYAMEHSAASVTETASLTVRAASKAADISKDEDVLAGVAVLLDCWAYGDELREWFVYHPPEILSEQPDAAPQYGSPELRNAIPKLADAYPCILNTTPDLLEVQQMNTQTQPEAATPAMSM